MGNSSTSFVDSYIGNPFFSSGSSADQCSKLFSQFKLISTYQDDLFKCCSVIQHKQTAQLIIAKEMDCPSQLQMNKLYKQFQNRKTTLNDDNLIRLRYVLKKKTDGVFSDQFKIVLFFDYVLANLGQELTNRVKNKIMFSPEEINSILCGAIRGYAFLEQLNMINDKIRIKNIYFGLKQKDPCIKITDSKLFPTSSNIDIIRNRQRQQVFLSPEQLKFLAKPQTFGKIEQGRKLSKAGVFSLGMIIIELCLTLPSMEMYDYNQLNLNYPQLQTRLNIIKNKYPLSIFYILREMTQRNEDSRPSFIKLRDSLPTNLKNQQSKMTLSIINPSNNRQINTVGTRMTKVLPPTGYTKLINPTTIHPNQRKMNTTTLTSQYRPNVDASEVYTNGNMYTGQKKDNLRHGKGKYLYNDGSYYYGDWFKGKMQGFGQIYNTNGELQYEGQWKDDHYHGKGKLIGQDVDWIKYQGDFINGKMQGFGQMIFKDGNRYKGQFRADYPWGKGRMIMRDGQIQAGIWQRGNFIKQL